MKPDTYKYTICVHDNPYREIADVELRNPAQEGDFISDSKGDLHHVVFKVSHCITSNVSNLHVTKTDGAASIPDQEEPQLQLRLVK